MSTASTTNKFERIAAMRWVVGDNSDISWNVPFTQGPQASVDMFALQCTSIPPGCAVSLNCSQAGPQPPINIPWTTVTTPNMIVGMSSAVPANFQATIVCSFRSNGHVLPPGASVQFCVYVEAQPDGNN